MIEQRAATYRQPRRLAILGALLASWIPASGWAHQTPKLLAFWGGFDVSPARCQRRIGVETAACADAVRRVREACVAAQIAGGTCDSATTDATVAQIRAATLDQVDHACGSDDLQPLGFLSSLELDADVDTACMGADTALLSAVYSPVLRGVTPSGGADPLYACAAATMHAAGRLLPFAFKMRRQALDHIAVKDLPPSKKQALIDRTATAIDQARARVELLMRTACSDADFLSIYHRDVMTFLAGVAGRADCLAGSGYVQATVVCPKPVCGNGIQETGEQCDDGNTTDGDGCHSNCTLEAPSAQ